METYGSGVADDALGVIMPKHPHRKISEYPVNSPALVVAGPDGNMWATNFNVHRVAQVTTSGTILGEVKLPAKSYPKGIAVGGNGNLYVAEFGTGQIAEINGAGVVTQHDIPLIQQWALGRRGRWR